MPIRKPRNISADCGTSTGAVTRLTTGGGFRTRRTIPAPLLPVFSKAWRKRACMTRDRARRSRRLCDAGLSKPGPPRSIPRMDLRGNARSGSREPAAGRHAKFSRHRAQPYVDCQYGLMKRSPQLATQHRQGCLRLRSAGARLAGSDRLVTTTSMTQTHGLINSAVKEFVILPTGQVRLDHVFPQRQVTLLNQC